MRFLPISLASCLWMEGRSLVHLLLQPPRWTFCSSCLCLSSASGCNSCSFHTQLGWWNHLGGRRSQRSLDHICSRASMGACRLAGRFTAVVAGLPLRAASLATLLNRTSSLTDLSSTALCEPLGRICRRGGCPFGVSTPLQPTMAQTCSPTGTWGQGRMILQSVVNPRTLAANTWNLSVGLFG